MTALPGLRDATTTGTASRRLASPRKYFWREGNTCVERLVFRQSVSSSRCARANSFQFPQRSSVQNHVRAHYLILILKNIGTVRRNMYEFHCWMYFTVNKCIIANFEVIDHRAISNSIWLKMCVCKFIFMHTIIIYLMRLVFLLANNLNKKYLYKIKH